MIFFPRVCIWWYKGQPAFSIVSHHSGGVEVKLEVSEELRLKLLEEEFKLRAKQPTAWTKIKFRPYANFRRPKVAVEQKE